MAEDAHDLEDRLNQISTRLLALDAKGAITERQFTDAADHVLVAERLLQNQAYEAVEQHLAQAESLVDSY